MFSLMQDVKRAVLAKVAQRELAVALAVVGATLGSSARAAGEFTIDASTIVSVITGGVTTISAIGIAVLSLVVVIKLFKWVQRVL